MKDRRRKILGILLALLVLVGALAPPVRTFFDLPAEQQVVLGEKIQLSWQLPPSWERQIAWIIYDSQGSSRIARASGGFSTTEAGDLHLQLKLFGIIPLKNINIQVVKPVAVVPGGHSIGILLHTHGVLVVGEAGVETPQGEKRYPARRAGLEVGDVILAVNGQEVKSEEDLASLVHSAGKAGKKVELLVRRGEREFTVNIQPEYCRETGRYRIGLYVRDSTAGVGTLTFYHPTRGIYGALGHKVMPEYCSHALEITGGKIIAAAVQGIQQARKGQPGEKIGLFLDNPSFSGIIQKNTPFGIFGVLSGRPLPGPYGNPVPVALNNQVRTGRAEILTVVSGEQVEAFEAYIERVLPQQYSNGKGLIIRITDPRLLSLTGGIIQGMSGSPILQDGKLVGAVTHVFVNDPTRGYGVLAEWMLKESGLWEDESAQETTGKLLVELPGSLFFI
ncbi:SpoIVB peptidase [Moorellaceae bacterium AZ2]